MQGFGNCKYGSTEREVLRLGVNLILTAATGTEALQSPAVRARAPGLRRLFINRRFLNAQPKTHKRELVEPVRFMEAVAGSSKLLPDLPV